VAKKKRGEEIDHYVNNPQLLPFLVSRTQTVYMSFLLLVVFAGITGIMIMITTLNTGMSPLEKYFAVVPLSLLEGVSAGLAFTVARRASEMFVIGRAVESTIKRRDKLEVVR
jgi:hypothetical protein